MTLESQRQALATLAQVWALAPDIRLGQLVAHLGYMGETLTGKGLGDLEDDELVAILNRHRAELAARLSGTTPVPAESGALASLSGSPMSSTAASS